MNESAEDRSRKFQAAGGAGQRARVVIFAAFSVAIVAVSVLLAVDLVTGLSFSICYEEYEYIGEAKAYRAAVDWLAVTALIALTGVGCLTYAPTRAWRICAACSGAAMLVACVAVLLIEGLVGACQ